MLFRPRSFFQTIVASRTSPFKQFNVLLIYSTFNSFFSLSFCIPYDMGFICGAGIWLLLLFIDFRPVSFWATNIVVTSNSTTLSSYYYFYYSLFFFFCFRTNKTREFLCIMNIEHAVFFLSSAFICFKNEAEEPKIFERVVCLFVCCEWSWYMLRDDDEIIRTIFQFFIIFTFLLHRKPHAHCFNLLFCSEQASFFRRMRCPWSMRFIVYICSIYSRISEFLRQYRTKKMTFSACYLGGETSEIYTVRS